MTQKRYTAEISKGQGIIDETVALLQVWQPGMDTVALKDKVRREGTIDRATALRVDDIVGRLFSPRYLSNGAAAAVQMKQLVESRFPVGKLTQIFLIHTARAHVILHDFICEVYWGRFAAGATEITRQDGIDFVERAKNTGLVDPPWSESTTVRIARYLCTALMDFGMASKDKAGRREILPFRLDPLTALYLAHDLHFSGLSDDAVLNSPDWMLFGLEPLDVKPELERVAGGHFILQSTGGLQRISWQHSSMEEALGAISA